MDLSVLITGGVGLVTTIVGSLTSWFFARKKYYTEVDYNEIKNLKESLSVYKEIVEDLRKEVKYTSSRNTINQREIYRLKGVVINILNMSCSNESCKKRRFMPEEEVAAIIRDMDTPITFEENEVTA